LLRKGKLKAITIDIDSSVVKRQRSPGCAVKGYNAKKLGNKCYNLQFAWRSADYEGIYKLDLVAAATRLLRTVQLK
jgi:hypothetical protein